MKRWSIGLVPELVRFATVRAFEMLQLAYWKWYRRQEYQLDQSWDSPDLEMATVTTMEEFLGPSNILTERGKTQNCIAERNRRKSRFALGGFCQVCNSAATFLADWLHSSDAPNWRERLLCTTCGLNSRKRLVLSRVCTLVGHLPARIYLYEQTTNFYKRLCLNLGRANVVGSEWLGHGTKPGLILLGVRHEDALRLSFPNDIFDLVVSNDVYEHIPDIELALCEAYRVLLTGGHLLMTVPFDVNLHKTRRRAEMVGTNIFHHYDAVYHTNPIDPRGSLVFYDFGWDLLDIVRKAGFSRAWAEWYHSFYYGYMGQHLIFLAQK